MLDDVPGLINPIIQSMIATNRSQQEVEDRKQRAEALKTEAGYKQAELKHQDAVLAETQREHDLMMQHNRDMLEKVHIPQLQATLEHQGLENLATKTGLAKQGVTGLQGPEGVAIPDQATQLANEVAVIKNRAAATMSGQQSAQLSPEGTQVFQREKDFERVKQDNLFHQQMLMEAAHGADAQKLAGINNAASMSRTQVEGANHLRGIMLLHSLGLDDGNGTSANKAKTISDGVFNGTVDPDKLSKDDKTLVTNYLAANGETLPTGQNYKNYTNSIEAASRLQDIIRQGRDLAQKYSVDSPGATKLGNANMRLGPLGVRTPPIGTDANGLMPGSPAKTANEGYAGYVGQYIKQLEGSNRQSDANIARQLVGTFDPKATIAQNLENINKRAESVNNSLKQSTAGINPNRVNIALQNKGITDFGNAQQGQYKIIHSDPSGKGPDIGSNDGKTWFNTQTGAPIK